MKKFVLGLIVLIIIITVSILYNTLPRLELNGTKNMVISYRDKYQEPGVIVKNANSDYISKVKIESNVDTNVLGNYYVDYSLKIRNKTIYKRRNVKVIDNIAPIIKLKGEQIIEISINSNYQEPGYKAQDEYDGDLTDKVEVTGNIDTTTYGEYVLTYKVTDNSNNKTEVNRIIKVIDEEKPKFKCKAEYSAFKVGTKNPVGCEALDNFDGDITNKIKIEGNYNTNKKGIYKVTYKVKDEAGNESKIEHNIVIYEEKTDKVVFLTFDDGPTELTPKILKILKEEDVKATFFISPQTQTENYKYIKEELEQGHEIGIHGYHKSEELYKNSTTFIKYFEEVQELLKEITKEKINIYRFPGGSKSKYLNSNVFNEIKTYLDNNKITYYDWNIDSADSSSISITHNEIIKETFNQIINCDNNEITILMHDSDTKEETAKSLKTIITILKEMGYEFKTISNSTPIQFRK